MKTLRLLFCVVMIIGCSSENPNNKKKVSTTEGNKIIKAKTVATFDSIGIALKRKKYDLHGKHSLIALQYMNKIPIHFLGEADNSLKDAISKYGLRPFYGIVLDITYRLSTHPTKENQKRLALLRKLVREKWQKESDSDSRVLIRSSFNNKYKIYSENIAQITLAFALSAKGQGIFSMGGRSEDLVRLTAMLHNSLTKLKHSELTALERKGHQTVVDELMDMIDRDMIDKGQIPGLDMDQLMNSIGKGILVGKSLFESETDSFIEGMEDRLDQMEGTSNPRSKGRMGPQAYMMSETEAAGSSPPDGTQTPEGYTLDEDTPIHTSRSTDENGATRVTTTTTYKNDNGDKVSITNSSSTAADGTSTNSTHVTHTSSDGTTNTQTYDDTTIRQSSTTDPNGNVTSVSTYDANGNVSETINNEPVDNGETQTTVKTYDSDGNVIETRVFHSAKGCTQGCDGSNRPEGLPVDESSTYIGPNPMKPYTIEDLYSMAMGPLVNPNPEEFSGMNNGMFAHFNQPIEWCPAFVAFCLEPSDGCACNQTVHPDFKGQGASQCASMLCENGCNPNTGMCGSAGDLPGTLIPPSVDNNVNLVGWSKDIFSTKL